MKFAQIDTKNWGYTARDLTPEEIIARLVSETQKAIAAYDVLPRIELADDQPEFRRVAAEIPVSRELFDAFFNSRAGYRAQYALSEEVGEVYNRTALRAIIPLLTPLEAINSKGVDLAFRARSLGGPHTKLWFPRTVTALEYEDQLCGLPEVICWKPWQAWWADKAPPHKGLLAPDLEEPEILLNGTFLRSSDSEVWNQKPFRSQELHEAGWT